MKLAVVVFVSKGVTRMAKYTYEEIMYGEKYNIESDVFMVAYELVKQGIKPKDVREQLQEFYLECMMELNIEDFHKML